MRPPDFVRSAGLAAVARARAGRSAVVLAAVALTGGVTALGPRTLAAQAVSVSVAPLAPFGGATRKEKATDSASVVLYGMAYVGEAGNVLTSIPESRQGFSFSAIDLMFSASALPTLDGKSFSVAGNLERLRAHVTLTPLDSAQRPITALSALEVLAALPDTSLVAPATGDSTSTRVGRAALRALSHSFIPPLEAGAEVGKKAGPVVASFLNLYHRPSARLQVGYIRDARSFGWMWYATEQDVIEGTHRGSVALELGPGVRYVRVQLLLTGEWKSHGSWQRDVDVVLKVADGPTP